MTKRKELGVKTHAFGEASVYQVMGKMINNGILPAKPAVDDHGVDLYAISGNKACRIQVKSASKKIRVRPERANPSSPYYEFELNKVRATYEGGVQSTPQMFSERSDFVVLHASEDDVFLVVPSEILDNVKSIRYSLEQRSKDVDMEAMRKDRESGMTFEQLGQKYGMSSPTAYQRLAGIHGTAHGDLSKEIRSYEDRWNLISEFLKSE